MKIRRFSTLGFRGLPDRSFDFADARTGRAADVVLVTGPTASGKTSFLEALIAAKENVGPYGGTASDDFYLKKGESAAKVRVDWWLSTEDVARTGAPVGEYTTESIFGESMPSANDRFLAALLTEYDLDPTIGKFDYFHASRRLPLAAGGLAGQSAALERMKRLTRDNDKYAWVPQYLVDLAIGLVDMSGSGKQGTELLNHMLGLVGMKKGYRGIVKTTRGMEPRFVDRHDNLYTLPELSEGERQLILYATTFMRCGLNQSVIFLDTPELHLTSQEAAQLVPALERIGRDNQLIIATGSKDVVAALPSATLVRLDGTDGRSP